MLPVDLRVKRLHPDAKLPSRATDGSAGLDLYVFGPDCDRRGVYVRSDVATLVQTGIAVEIPAGYVGLVFLRSSMGDGYVIPHAVGVIDSDYRGEILVPLRLREEPWSYLGIGDRIAQLVVVPFLATRVVEVETLTETARGAGGFGSTGTR